MPVDWSGWMTATTEQQNEMWRRYRDEVKRESEESKASNYAAMNAALRGLPIPKRGQ